ncbi:MAG: PP2C family serine/threonine-protein phosphatase [Pseudomonadota bacterium]
MTQLDIKLLSSIGSTLGPDNPEKGLSWRSAGRTHIGHVRALNEDDLFESIEQQLWCVADGMGGLSRGDYASKAIIKAIKGFSRHPTLRANIEDLEHKLLAVNDTCRSAFRAKRLGSTVAILFAFNNMCFCLWAGDSRIYRLRGGELTQLTEDHTLQQEKLSLTSASGETTNTDASARSAHVLTRAVGVHKTLRLDMTHHNIEAGDRFMLCSDGLYNALPANTIRALLGHGEINASLDELFTAALEHGGQDNITAVVAEAL